jgi:nitroreductase
MKTASQLGYKMPYEHIKQSILDTYNFRHACKIFDTNKNITDEDFNFLLEVARLSPTSFGMQGVKLYVITNQEKKEQLKPVCWNQNQIDTCSHLVVFTTKTKDLKPNSNWVKARFAERGLDAEMEKVYLSVYENFHKSGEFTSDTYQWGSRQAYILMANMLTSAAKLGIDSCPIEGFEKSKVEDIMGLDTSKEEVAVITAFGYRVNPQSKKNRLPLEEIVEFIK